MIQQINHHCIALRDRKIEHLNIILQRHIVGRYRVTTDIYMFLWFVILL